MKCEGELINMTRAWDKEKKKKILSSRQESKCEILGRQTKVAQRTKHAIPCDAIRGENQQSARGKDNRPAFWRKIVTFPNKKLLSIDSCPVYCSGCLKLNF